MDTSTIVGIQWYSGNRTCGFVLIKDMYSGYKCYLGPFPGQRIEELKYTPEMAAWQIRSYGAKVSFEVADAVFPGIMRGTEEEPLRYDNHDIDRP